MTVHFHYPFLSFPIPYTDLGYQHSGLYRLHSSRFITYSDRSESLRLLCMGTHRKDGEGVTALQS
jgi:hypothetical protein